MCGIAGYCGPERRFSAEKLQRMLRAIEHRGPDDEGAYSAAAGDGNRVWLGSRRLAIQDPSPAGHQPMVEPHSGNAIAFNGEIYNFLELREALAREGYAFRSRCDTEVALASWGRKGPGGVDEWRGMFAAAVWDARAEELWVVRDPWGIKPLYYHWDGEGIAFCSEVRGLVAAGVVEPKLSRRGLEDYLRYGAPQDPVTILDGVYALLPGCALRWSGGKLRTHHYTRDIEEAMTAGEVEPLLRQIVRQQMISDRPVVVFLSGGVDSSVVALLARQEAGAGVQTLAVVFEEEHYSEREYARRVAARIGTGHQEMLLRGAEAREQALEAIHRMDQPTIDGVNTYVVSRAARQAGFTVALSGLGGDEFFGGYETFRRTRLVGQVQKLAQRAPGLAQAAGKLVEGAGRGGQRLGRYLRSGAVWEHPYFIQRTVFLPEQVERLARGGTASAEADRAGEARQGWLLEQAEALDPLNQVSWLEAASYMGNTLLRDSDQMSMAHSLEVRVPLVDHVLAGRLLATPGRQKGFGRTSKLWLREAFGRALPPEVFARKKSGFVLPFEVWLRGPLRAEVEGTLLANPAGLWEPRAALEVWEEFLAGQVNWSRPWALYVLSRWASKHVHGEIEGISGLKSTT